MFSNDILAIALTDAQQVDRHILRVQKGSTRRMVLNTLNLVTIPVRHLQLIEQNISHLLTLDSNHDPLHTETIYSTQAYTNTPSPLSLV